MTGGTAEPSLHRFPETQGKEWLAANGVVGLRGRGMGVREVGED